MTTKELSLRNVLRANAAFSIVSALVAAAAAAPMASSLALPVAELQRLAVNLGIFAVFLIVLATRPSMRRTWILRSVLFVALADVLWVVGTIAGLTMGLEEASGLGRALVSSVGLIVGTFGALELRGWRDVRRETGGTASPRNREPGRSEPSRRGAAGSA